MPYIPMRNRGQLDLAPVQDVTPATAGELTYVVYLIARNYGRRRGGRFQHWMEAKAALREAADEIERRILGPYEDQKLAEHGDVE